MYIALTYESCVQGKVIYPAFSDNVLYPISMIPQRYTYHVVLLLCCLYTSLLVKGQGTCSSSALAPVFSETFGQGSSSSSKTTVPAGFNTKYSFQNNNDPLDQGKYIVTPLVQNSGHGDWAVGADHTGNSNGNMFLVNAGKDRSLFFSQQVDNLCPGSTYNFSAWIANVNTCLLYTSPSPRD